MARTATDDPDVFDHPDERRYEIESDGRLAGFAAYKPTAERIVITHTEIDGAYAGRGLGARLVKAALDDIRANKHSKVTPSCPFVAGYIDRHSEYGDLVAGEGDAPTSREG